MTLTNHRNFLFVVAATALAGAHGNAEAATINYNLVKPSNNINTSQVYSQSGIDLTVTPVGFTSLSANANGLCVYSSRDGCGIPTGNTSKITSVNLNFNKTVKLSGFSIAQTNICGNGCTPSSNAEFKVNLPSGIYGPFSFGQNQPSIATPLFVPIAPFIVAASTPLSWDTDVITDPQTGFQYRLSSLQLEEYQSVPGPLGLSGAGVAFSLSRRLRKRIQLR